jgi:hypothetical protein
MHTYTVAPPYLWVIHSKTSGGYVKPQIIPDVVYNINNDHVKVKGKGHPITGHQGPRRE